MDPIISLLHSYHSFHTKEITNRFFKHADLLAFLEKFKTNPLFEIREVGQSVQSRSIKLITCGDGPVKVLLWSQMHGNEATATMALLDLLNFLGFKEHDDTRNTILQNCTLHIL
ncbi:MAG: peptidase M14, partial [Bacteroidetes bacterium]|nr:peptidase M14 [Bacteroidota bacterium]